MQIFWESSLALPVAIIVAVLLPLVLCLGAAIVGKGKKHERDQVKDLSMSSREKGAEMNSRFFAAILAFIGLFFILFLLIALSVALKAGATGRLWACFFWAVGLCLLAVLYLAQQGGLGWILEDSESLYGSANSRSRSEDV